MQVRWYRWQSGASENCNFGHPTSCNACDPLKRMRARLSLSLSLSLWVGVRLFDLCHVCMHVRMCDHVCMCACAPMQCNVW